MNFITCPFCAGREKISPEAADEIAAMIESWLYDAKENALKVEIQNIHNMIMNQQERATIQPQEALPLCPTPKKRKYSNFAHVKPFAAKWFDVREVRILALFRGWA